MTGNRIALEQFPPTSLTATLERLAPPPPDLPPQDLPGNVEAMPGDVPPMGDPPIRRPPVLEEDPYAKEIEALKAELSEACGHLGDVIAAVESGRAAALDTALQEMAERVADVGSQFVGSVVDEGFALEIAAAIVDLAARIPHEAADLHVATRDHEILKAVLAEHAPETAITLIPDAGLTTGQARMVWPDGGADLDGTRLAARVAPLISQRISDLMPRRQ